MAATVKGLENDTSSMTLEDTVMSNTVTRLYHHGKRSEKQQVRMVRYYWIWLLGFTPGLTPI
jgi:hypothetical protein